MAMVDALCRFVEAADAQVAPARATEQARAED